MQDIYKAIAELSPEKRELLERLLEREGATPPRPRLFPRERNSSDYPLSYGQRALWFLQQLEPQNVAYNVSCAMRVLNAVDLPALRRSFQKLIDRHASLRTTFRMVNDEPRQQIHERLEVCFQEVAAFDWTESELYDFLVQQARRPFDLERSPLVRIVVVSRSSAEHVLLMVFHHIITDLWSLVVLTQELAALYSAESAHREATLGPLSLQYTDYILWQRDLLAGSEGERAWDYWREKLHGQLPVLTLPTKFERPAMQTHRGASQARTIPADLTNALNTLTQKEGVTLYMLLLAAYEVLLYRYTGEEDLLIGSPVSGRSVPELRDMVGYFVNTIVLREDLSGNPSFTALLRKTRQTILDAFQHQDYPFALLTERLRPPRDSSRSPIFQTMFVLQRSQSQAQQDLAGFVQGDERATLDIGDLSVQFLPVYKKTAQFDLRLTVAELTEGLSVSINYNADLFDADAIERMLLHYQAVLRAIVHDPTETIDQLKLLTDQERDQLQADWNPASSSISHLRITDLLEAQVEKTPEAIAIVFQNLSLTYRELNTRANQLARFLQSKGVGPETLVGICLERSLDMIVGLLGILKAGGAYVPLDPAYPNERKEFILGDAAIRVLVTNERFAGEWLQSVAQIICLDSEGQTISHLATAAPPNQAVVNNPAYVIYTSGSTGNPKGVVIEHRSTVALINWAQTVFTPEDLASVLASATINFDCSIFELYVPLCSGGKVILARNALELPSLQEAQEITLLNTVPSSMTELLRSNGIPTSVRTVNLSGDYVSRELVTQLYEKGHIEQVYNGYGPTEDTTFTTFALINRIDDGPPPIGRPIANEQTYVLDRNMNLVPVGIPGELFIGGLGLARGYLNRPDLTAEKFVPNPFSTMPGDRLYRTGDVARYRANGELEFAGRIDHQVKIRGFRVELAEVEAALVQHPEIREAVVLAREDTPGVKRLVAYVVPVHAATLDTIALRRFIGQKLPSYMVPSNFVVMDSLPRTTGCKVDRRALPTPSLDRPELAVEYMPPRTNSEADLASIWSRVLGLERVGVFDNFFDLGGDSILAVQVISRANQDGLRLTTKQLFQHQTISELAQVVATAPIFETEQHPVTGEVPLTPIQHWFFEQNLPEPEHWNLAMLLEEPTTLEPELLRAVTEQLTSHHDALRMRFFKTAGGWQQTISPAIPQNCFLFKDFSHLPESDRPAEISQTASRLQKSLDLSDGPLLRVVLLGLGPEQPRRLLIIIHHLVLDVISGRLFLEDLHLAYEQIKGGHAIQLPRKTSSIKIWAERLVEYANSNMRDRELSYWIWQTTPGSETLPRNSVEGKNTAASARTIIVSLSREETETLLRNTLAFRQAQINDVLLTAVVLALTNWTGRREIQIHLEGHGREDIFDGLDVSRTVGWFTALFPLLLSVSNPSTPTDALRAVRRQLRQIPNKGIGYGVLRYLGKDPDLLAQHNAHTQPEVSFNYLGQFDQVFSTAARIFKPASESIGPSRSTHGVRSHVLDITGKILNHQLVVEWTYSRNLHDKETIAQVAEAFLCNLRTMISTVAEEPRREALGDPSTPIEEAIAEVWKDALKLDRISVHANFFDIGGDSRSGHEVLDTLEKAFEVSIPWQAFVESATISEFSRLLDELLLRDIEALAKDEIHRLSQME